MTLLSLQLYAYAQEVGALSRYTSRAVIMLYLASLTCAAAGPDGKCRVAGHGLKRGRAGFEHAHLRARVFPRVALRVVRAQVAAVLHIWHIRICVTVQHAVAAERFVVIL